jgi:hypothetical protein
MSIRRGRFGLWLASAMVFLAAAGAGAGCGGGSASSSSGSASTASGEPSMEFLGKKGKNEIALFGEEAGRAEREVAGEVVARSLEAREAAEFVAQCETLTLAAIREIPGATGRANCATSLKKFAEPLSGSKEARKDTLSGPIAAMRVKGKKGYALYHGNDGNDYSIVMGKEDGTWKAASILTVELES